MIEHHPGTGPEGAVIQERDPGVQIPVAAQFGHGYWNEMYTVVGTRASTSAALIGPGMSSS